VATKPFASPDVSTMRQQNTGRLLLRTFRAYNARAIAALGARGYTGIGLTHTALLINLDLEGTRISTLAERAGMTRQAMGQLVDDLERQGYLARARDPSDRRAALVTLTDAGCRFFDDAHAVMIELEAEYASVLGADRLAALRDSLLALLEQDRRTNTATLAQSSP